MAKPACIAPAAGSRLADTVACVDHAQTTPSRLQIRRKAPTSVTDTLTVLIVV